MDRYRDLLAPIVGASDLFDLDGAAVVDLSAEADTPFTLAFLLLALGARDATVVTPSALGDPGSALRHLAVAADWLRTTPHRLIEARPPSAATLNTRLTGFDLERLALGESPGLDAARLRHRVESTGAWTLADESADLILSFSMLEHLHPVQDALGRLARMLRPGGVGIHFVDLVDHRVYGGSIASPFAFLGESPGEELVHDANRLRVHQWTEAFEQHGLRVERVDQWADRRGPSADERAAFVEPYRSMTAEQLAATGARFFVSRAGATMRRRAEVRAQPSAATAAAAAAAGPAEGRAADYVSAPDATRIDGEPLVRAVAFYLPQFHPIPENDAWWGEGFTEWTNVRRARPQFAGHDQPRVPGDLGYYDLRDPVVQRRQAALAQQHGLAAFCFYHYWFSGRRLLQRPLEQFMADAAITLPFCVCWANEPWTRRWDGNDGQVLMPQVHSVDGDTAFIDDLAGTLAHPRYLTIEGRPVLLVYRPGLMPDPAGLAARWRHRCAALALPDPFLVAVEAFETLDPRTIGFDAAAEFPPNTAGRPLPPTVTPSLALLNPGYAGSVYRYADMWQWRVHRPAPDYTLFRSACTGFDNEARRPGAGSTFVGASAPTYGRWLTSACRTALQEPSRDRRLVFVNAWNEWAEAAYLEPDERHGFAMLDATARAVNALRGDWTLLVVSHDACRGGAQHVLLEWLTWLRQHTAIRCAVLCLAGGEWLPKFQALAHTALLPDLEADAAAAGDDVAERLLDLCGGTPALVFANTVASGRALPLLAGLGAPIVTELHELTSSVQRYAGQGLHGMRTHTSHYIACAEPVRWYLRSALGVAAEAVTTVPASIDDRPGLLALPQAERQAPRASLGLSDATYLVVGCGIGMPFRKGADLFIDVARRFRARGRTDVAFVWIGAFDDDERDPDLGRWAHHLARAEAEGWPATFTGVVTDAAPYLQVADLLLLPSREDPFPLVVLEAAACEVPAVCFADAGGMPSFVGDDAGVVVPFGDIDAMADAADALLGDLPRRLALGAAARAKWEAHYTTDATAPALLATCRRVARQRPTVSVIVPNYNHARYLPRRLESIVRQTFRDVEVLVLDDASADDSLAVIAPWRDRADVRTIVNEQNSGSPFVQWLRGLDEARGEFVWIAESDDACEPELVATLLGLLRDPSVSVAYANSRSIDEQGDVTGDYGAGPYLGALSPVKWRTPYRVTGAREVADGFGVKNTILSASGVLFRRFAIDDALRADLSRLRLAGDWRFFAQAMRGGEVAYTPRPLNYHRRHEASVVGGMRTDEFFREFADVQRWIVTHYPLDDAFEAKWDAYLREQWAAFFPSRPFDEILGSYPLEEMRRLIADATA